jgi:hypothetical protein
MGKRAVKRRFYVLHLSFLSFPFVLFYLFPAVYRITVMFPYVERGGVDGSNENDGMSMSKIGAEANEDGLGFVDHSCGELARLAGSYHISPRISLSIFMLISEVKQSSPLP